MERIDLRSDTVETMVDRLAEDHADARRLAEGLGSMVAGPVETNRVRVRAPDAPAALASWRAQGVWAAAVGPDRIRFVTHGDVTAADVARARATLARAA